MKKIIFTLLIFLAISCKHSPKGNVRNDYDSTNNNQIIKTKNWADSVLISNNWIMTYFKNMDSLTITQIDKVERNDSLPFYKMDTTYAKKYIKCYYPGVDGIYAVSKQYSNDKYISLILYYAEECVWHYDLVTIDKNNFEYIDSYKLLYNPGDCSEIDIKSEMKTIFNKNKFEVNSVMDYWTNKDSTIKDPLKMDIHKEITTRTRCEILPNGVINKQEDSSEKIIH